MISTNLIIANYFEAFHKANANPVVVPIIEETESDGWFIFDGKRIGRKSLLEFTKNLETRAAAWGKI